MQVWRISKLRHAESAFSGEGASFFQGRWNPKGVRMVYTPTSRALAALEYYVHLNADVPLENLVMLGAALPSNAIGRQVEVTELPEDWRTPNHPSTQLIGARWIQNADDLALSVPSAVVDGEYNILVNPAHPDFSKLSIGTGSEFTFDQRMLRGLKR